MRIAVVTERLPASPWHQEHLAVPILRALAARGHDTHAVCESVDDEMRLGEIANISLHPRRGYCHRSSVRPWALREFAQTKLKSLHPDATLSLTRLLSAQVWMPIVGSASTIISRVARIRGFEPLFREARALPLTLTKSVLETIARGDHYTVRRVFAFGPRAAESARQEWTTLRDRIADVGFIAAVTPPATDERASIRRRIRNAIGTDEHRSLILVSSPSGMQRDLAAVIEAAAHAYKQSGDRAPILLIAAADAYAVHDAAVRLGAHHVVRLAGVSHRPEGLLCAADVALAWSRGPAAPCAAGSASRFIADALAFGLPVIAVRGAPGAELIGDVRAVRAPGDTRAVGPGSLVDNSTGLGWYVALQSAVDPAWHREAKAAATARAEQAALIGDPIARLAERIDIELAVAAGAPRSSDALRSSAAPGNA